MTIKQFAYLGSGVFIAWVFLSAPLPGVVKLIFALLCAGGGFAFAFIPIDGRPLDTMILNFLKALTSQDQFVYQKAGVELLHILPLKQKVQAKTEAPGIKRAQLEAMLYTISKASHTQNQYDKKEEDQLSSVAAILTNIQEPPAKPTPTLTPQETKAQEVAAKHEQKPQQKVALREIEDKAEKIEDELKEAKAKSDLAKAQESAGQNTPNALLAHEKATDISDELTNMQAQKEQLEKELITLKTALETHKKQVFVPTTAQPPPSKPPKVTQRIRMIPKDMVKAAGVPFVPDTPNLIVGIVKDPRGNVLPNILVEIKDKEGNPVRAFKTNGVGQFASATTLANGVYTIEFEDPKDKQQFETVQIEAKGEILSPLEVISQDQRELLRQSLFKTS